MKQKQLFCFFFFPSHTNGFCLCSAVQKKTTDKKSGRVMLPQFRVLYLVCKKTIDTWSQNICFKIIVIAANFLLALAKYKKMQQLLCLILGSFCLILKYTISQIISKIKVTNTESRKKNLLSNLCNYTLRFSIILVFKS